MDVSKLLKIKEFKSLEYNKIHNIITFCYYLLNSSLNDSLNDSLLTKLAEAEQGIIIQIINDDIHNYKHIYKEVDLTEHKKKGDFAVKVINLIQPTPFAVAVAVDVPVPVSIAEEEFKSAESTQNPNEVDFEFSADNNVYKEESATLYVNGQTESANISVNGQTESANISVNGQTKSANLYVNGQKESANLSVNGPKATQFEVDSLKEYRIIEQKLDTISGSVEQIIQRLK
jgi:hypothetical protein